MNKDELLALKERLLAEITPLIIENAGDGTDKFSLLMRVIQSGRATNDVYNRAYDTAKSIEGTPDRLDAMMALLDEVEVDLTRSEDGDLDVIDVIDTPQEAELPQELIEQNSGSAEPQEQHDDQQQG